MLMSNGRVESDQEETHRSDGAPVPRERENIVGVVGIYGITVTKNEGFPRGDGWGRRVR